MTSTPFFQPGGGAVEVLILSEPDVRSLVSPTLALEAVRTGFRSMAAGYTIQPPSLDLEISSLEAELHVKGAYIGSIPFFSFKAASAFYRNAERGLPVLGGLSLVFDASTGFVRAVIFDNGYLTELRTGAAGALATDLLANPHPDVVCIIGSGGQARFQLESLLLVRRPSRVVVWARNAGRAQIYAREMGRLHDVPVDVADSAESAVRNADIVVTTTPARKPIVLADWVRPGTHITAMGSDFPDKQELDVGVLAKADRVVADTVANCLRSGEVHHAVEAGTLDVARVEELADVVAGRRPGRVRFDEITVADQCGLGMEDTAMANVVVTRALAEGLGGTIEIKR